MNDRLTLTVPQLAERMQVSKPTAYALVNRPGFPRLTVGRKILVPLAALERWLDEQAVAEKGRTRWTNA